LPISGKPEIGGLSVSPISRAYIPRDAMLRIAPRDEEKS